MRLDYHIHTTFSDGRSDLHEYVHEAAKKRIDEIGFSDHIHVKKEDWSMVPADLPKYVNKIAGLKKLSKIPIKAGLEVEFVPRQIEGLMHVINQFDLDYLMGSVHFIGDWQFDNEKQIEEWKRRDVNQVYEQYFDLVQTMAKTQLFDFVGHLDLVKKFGYRPKGDIKDLLIETIKTISKSGMCIEVNTGGLRKPCQEIYPSEKLLKTCFDNGLPITLGSDAHLSEDIGAGFDKAVDVAKKVGYTEIARFTKRRREPVDL